jgi:REP element-mobilizing transposase RayT
MARGNRRERIFRDEADRLYFARLFGEACERTGWRMHAWVLMSNHYHLMVETPGGNLVAGMRWLQSIYTRRHKVPPSGYGTGFSGIVTRPFLSEGGSGYYYCSLMDYMHLNPVRAGLVRAKRGESVRDYVWSSVARVMPCSQLVDRSGWWQKKGWPRRNLRTWRQVGVAL